MLVSQNVVANAAQIIGRYLFFGAVGFAVIIASVTAFCINNIEKNNITVIDTFELTCDININESDEISLYKLTVAGYPGADDANTEGIPPVALQRFDLIINGTIESIENIVLSTHINGDSEAFKYDFTYVLLEKVVIKQGQ